MKYIYGLIIICFSVLFIAGCSDYFVKVTDTGEVVEKTVEEFSKLPVEEQAKYVKASGLDEVFVETKVDPVTSAITPVLEVSKGVLPPPFDLVAYAGLLMVSIFNKVKSVRIAKGSKIGAQAIEVLKKIDDGKLWEANLKPLISDAELKARESMLKPIMPNKLL